MQLIFRADIHWLNPLEPSDYTLHVAMFSAGVCTLFLHGVYALCVLHDSHNWQPLFPTQHAATDLHNGMSPLFSVRYDLTFFINVR
jgi:hypothetical protein